MLWEESSSGMVVESPAVEILSQTWSWENCSSWYCLSRGLGQDDLKTSLLKQMTLVILQNLNRFHSLNLCYRSPQFLQIESVWAQPASCEQGHTAPCRGVSKLCVWLLHRKAVLQAFARLITIANQNGTGVNADTSLQRLKFGLQRTVCMFKVKCLPKCFARGGPELHYHSKK